MRKQTIAIAAMAALIPCWLTAQRGGMAVSGFQQFGADSVRTAPQTHMWGALLVANSPLSATQERRTVQTLGDGTQIEQSDSNPFYRDAQGRTRVEQSWKGKTTVVILDPVARFVARLDPDALTASKFSFGPEIHLGGIGIEEGTVLLALSPGRGGVSVPSADAVLSGGGGRRGGGGRSGGGNGLPVMSASGTGLGLSPRPLQEDLGTQNLNGAMAHGNRTTITIPAGQIGNNRDIHIVNERWYSDDLQMLVKSVNSDPRFGVTTFQLANITRTAPDAGLFQIPGSYAVTEEQNISRITGR